jgi:uncharacterized DUF497 family protein
MKFEWDEAKRQKTLNERGLDFARCEEVFCGPTVEFPDDRCDYGELRMVTIGFLEAELVVIVSTQRDESTRVISMRRATKHERELYEEKCN